MEIKVKVEVTKIKVLKFYAIIIDNFFQQNEYEAMLNESILLCKEGFLKDETHTGGAITHDGLALKKNKGLFLDNYYHIAKLPRESSNILTFTRKIFNLKLIDLLISIDPIYTYISTCNLDTTLLSYYENNSYYNSHTDGGMITSLCWLYQTPKSFTGGDLVFTASNKKVKCIPNRIIFFPSFLQHMVIPVKMKKNLLDKQLGRFCISNFTTYNEFDNF